MMNIVKKSLSCTAVTTSFETVIAGHDKEIIINPFYAVIV